MQISNLRMAALSLVPIFISAAISTTQAAELKTLGGAEEKISYECDPVIANLLRNNGGCKTGKCRYNIGNGKIHGFNGGVVATDGDKTSMVTVDEANDQGTGITNLELVKGKNGARQLTFTKISNTGRATTMQYNMTAGEKSCEHHQTQSREKGEPTFSVDYDPEFCAAAAAAFDGMDAIQAKTCDDSMKALVGSFEKRSNELSNESKTFHGASFFEKLKARSVSMATNDGQQQLMRAMKQRDRCMAATAEVNAAQPLKMNRAYLESILKPLDFMSGESMRMIDKRAWPLEGTKDRKTKR